MAQWFWFWFYLRKNWKVELLEYFKRSRYRRLDITDGNIMSKLSTSTKKAISSLEWALTHHRELPQTDDEFNNNQFEEMLGITYESARHKLSRMVRSDLLECRKITQNGTKINLYRKKLPLN